MFFIVLFKSFIRPSKLAISWLSSSVDVLGASLWISSDECAIIGPDCCNRFVNVFDNEIGAIDEPVLFVNDFLYGDAFWGRMATAGTRIIFHYYKNHQHIKFSERFVFIVEFKTLYLPLCLFGFEINGVVLRLGGGGPGTLKLCSGCPWPRGAFGTSIDRPCAYVMLGSLN